MLRTRVLSAIFIILPVVGWSVWAGGWWIFAFAALVAGVSGYEFYRMMRKGEHFPSLVVILAIIAVFFVDVMLPRWDIAPVALIAILMASISWQLFKADSTNPTVDWALSVAGGLYVGGLSIYFVHLRWLPDGLAWMILAILATWMSDSGAYFVGRAIGRHKLCPRLSPGKTWEGIAGGILGGLLAGAVIGTLAMEWLGAVGIVNGLVVGLLAAIVSPFGDLAVSMMKREVQVKDSGHLIPGHGGMLDRTDSLLFVVVTTFYFAIWFGG